MKTFAAALSAIALLAATPLSARDIAAGSELSADQITAGVRYFMPQLLGVVQDKCSGSLESDGYLATNGSALLEKFSEGSEENWGNARGLFLSFAMEGGAQGDALALLANLPDESLKPLIDGMIPMELGKRLKTRDCASIERVMETLDPLPAENFAQFIGVVFELALNDRRKKSAKSAGE